MTSQIYSRTSWLIFELQCGLNTEISNTFVVITEWTCWPSCGPISSSGGRWSRWWRPSSFAPSCSSSTLQKPRKISTLGVSNYIKINFLLKQDEVFKAPSWERDDLWRSRENILKIRVNKKRIECSRQVMFRRQTERDCHSFTLNQLFNLSCKQHIQSWYFCSVHS